MAHDAAQGTTENAAQTAIRLEKSEPPMPAAAPPAAAARSNRLPPRRLLMVGGGVPILSIGLWFGMPWLDRALNTVSTDDAYVSDYVTFVAPRVYGQVVKVLVEDNNRVRKGDVLVELDRTPYQVKVDIAEAAVVAAKADLVAATAATRGLVGKTRGLRFNLQHTIEQVDNQIALLRANVATLESQKATLVFAQQTFDRDAKLVGSHAVSQEEYDQSRAALGVAQAQVKQALEGVYQVRVSLGLPRIPPGGKDLTDVPADLDETFSTVRQAQSQLMEAAGEVGIAPFSYELTPKQLVEKFFQRYPGLNIDQIYEKIVREAPAVKQAESKVLEAQCNLDQAKLNLSYCTVYAEIDGVVSRRNVNPGNNVQAGQQVMALQSIHDLWVDANFKETQLASIRIGQHVVFYADMYGGRKAFQGHVSGFTMGTGSTLAILPPENATGNFVKIVQRLPVRIEVDNYDPEKAPLFIGLSVEPYVYVKEEPTGPHAGEVLQPYLAGLPTGQPPQAPYPPATERSPGAAAMSAVALPLPVARKAVNPWLVAMVVVIPAFMEVLDTTVANVSLRYIAGGLSAAVIDAEWVITSYLAANAVVVPISGWLSVRLGRRNYFLLSIAVFTVASGLCGMATSLWQIILFRALQGAGGGGLQPSSQSILIDSFPPEKQGAAMTLFGVAALLAPVVGPTLGGWLTVQYEWRWCFYINLPVGLLALVACYFLVEDPDYLKAQTAEAARQKVRFDGVGLGLLVIAMASWEVVLSKGQEWDWSGDPFWRVQTLAGLFVFGLVGLIVWETRQANPIINFRPLLERNFALSCLLIFSAYAVLFGATTSLPDLLQELFGYDALLSGLVMSPAGISAVLVLPIVGFLLGRQMDGRWLIAAGLVIVAVANFWMSQMNLLISPWQVIWPRVVMILGLSMLFAPLNVAAFLYLPRELRGAAVGLFALLRNEGGSVGTSCAQTLEERREQFHTLRLNEWLNHFHEPVNLFSKQFQQYYLQRTGDVNQSHLMTVQTLANMLQEQAASLAYFDCFLAFAVVALCLAVLVPFMKRSIAEKGAHVGAE